MKKVLVVDDALFMRNALKLLLEKNDFEVIGFGVDGEDAVQKYTSLQPDLVTMDITMPNMDGIEALKAIRDIDPSAKIVMVTAVGKKENVATAIMAGAKSFIVKPFDEKKVIDTLSKM